VRVAFLDKSGITALADDTPIDLLERGVWVFLEQVEVGVLVGEYQRDPVPLGNTVRESFGFEIF
jgi:hypothetical protein